MMVSTINQSGSETKNDIEEDGSHAQMAALFLAGDDCQSGCAILQRSAYTGNHQEKKEKTKSFAAGEITRLFNLEAYLFCHFRSFTTAVGPSANQYKPLADTSTLNC
jgi:hypothetical protein